MHGSPAHVGRWTHRSRLAVPFLLTVTAVAQTPAAPNIDLSATAPRGEGISRAIARHFEAAEAWPLRALALLALGQHWHPAATPMVTAALEDEETRPFAIELLCETEPEVLRCVLGDDALLDEVKSAAKNRNDLVRARALAILRRTVGEGVEIDSWRDFDRWRRDAADAGTFPGPWPEITERPENEDRTEAVPAARALDLRDAGLDLVIVIDSTGSMQRVIDSAVLALGSVVDLLSEVAPRFRVGIVEYRDFGDMSNGAGMVEPLTRNVRKALEGLSKVRAAGGGDPPERIEKGMEIALDRETGWNPQANKLVLVVGDAPAHEDVFGDLVAMVRTAYDDPLKALTKSRGPTTGQKGADEVRPVITSAISAHSGANPHMQRLAEVGHGTFATLDASDARQASREIAGHILVDAFGSTWRDSVGAMLEVWFAYDDAGAFKRRRR
jgi:Mg-chelatase subunit ChlD